MKNVRSNALNTNSLFTTTLFTPDTAYHIQDANIPGISITHPQETTRVGIVNFQGNIITYNELSVKLLVDEDLLAWKEIVKIFQTYHVPGTSDCLPIVGESFMEIFDSKSNYLFKICFHNCYLHSLGDLSYTTTDDNNLVILDVVLVYDYYTVE